MTEKVNKARDWLINEFIQALQQDQIPWERSWSATGEGYYNGSTNKPYRGINQFILWYKSIIKEYEDPRWVTFNQAKQLGWKMKGEKGTQKGTCLERWSIYDRVKKKNLTQSEYLQELDKERDPKEFYAYAKNFYVFNAEQFENVPALEEKETGKQINTIEYVERIGQNMGIRFLHGGDRAFYSPITDSIRLPDRNSFKDDYSYSATKLHEMAHATGHASRLNRDLTGTFGSESYAKEELRAEISSSFLMGEVGLDFSEDHINNHKAYIQSWIQVLQNEPNELFAAIKDANRIVDYLTELSEREISPNSLDKSEEEKIEANEPNIPSEQSLEASANTPMQESVRMEQNVVAQKQEQSFTLSQENQSIVASMPEERRERFFVWQQSLIDSDLSINDIETTITNALQRFVELQRHAENEIETSTFTENTLEEPQIEHQSVSIDLTYPDEQINQEIILSFVESHINDGDEWDIYRENGEIIMEVDGEIIGVSSFSELIERFKSDIEEDVANYVGYLDQDQIEYLDIEYSEPPESQKDVEVIEEQNVEVQNEDPKEQESNSSKELVADKEAKEKVDANVSLASMNYSQIAKLIDERVPLDVLASDLGFDLIPSGRKSMTTTEHDSLQIWLKENRFVWYSRDIKGGAVRFYMAFKEVDFKTAIKEMSDQYDIGAFKEIKRQKSKTASLTPEEKENQRLHKLMQTFYDHGCQNKNMREALAYLHKTRGIDPQITKLFVERNLLYQGKDDSKYHNPEVIFTTRNENGVLSGAFHRSCNPNSKYRGTYSGSDESRGWFFEPTAAVPFNWANNNQKAIQEGKEPTPPPFNTNKKLLVFEANIEMLSYMSILKEKNIDYRNFAYLSTNGIAKSESIDKTCELYGYNDVVVMYNNDRDSKVNEGKVAAEKAVARLSEKGINARVMLPSQCNDWNDTLLAKKRGEIELKTNKDKTKNTPSKESR